ncbi:hypothetical protein BS47DRAFT_1375709 [Hydnum rufescens UP504]|uniref:Protein ROT1 n=1 Tax=Hydnum rufescens UP504 TaxID=1448309 RepID=A0A9P6DZX0_9AGAM|nr:hypothetical protein BS47DRAFT_1375709 [Hydnum rufescens UP504]
MLSTIFASALLALTASPIPVRSQADIHNVTGLAGTWSSGSGAVQTGAGFANPVNFSFTYPKNTGISWSFTDTGFFEQAEYQFRSNGSEPSCITGVVLFQHGTYQFLDNGSIIATPFAPDGRIQVQDPCAAQSNTITQFNTSVLFSSWRIFQDPTRGPKLQLYRFDGAPLTPQFLVALPPNMLPTQVLTPNNQSAAVAKLRKLTFIVLGTVAGGAIGALMLVL